jgi:galactokinase
MAGKTKDLPAFEKLAVELVNAILARKPVSEKTGKKPAGVNVVTDKFNETVRKIYGDNFDCTGEINKLIEKGILEGHPVKGGFKIYLAGTKPNGSGISSNDLLSDLNML